MRIYIRERNKYHPGTYVYLCPLLHFLRWRLLLKIPLIPFTKDTSQKVISANNAEIYLRFCRFFIIRLAMLMALRYIHLSSRITFQHYC